MKKLKFLVLSLLGLAGTLALPVQAQTTYVPFQNLLATNGGFTTSTNGTWVLPPLVTNTTGVANVTKAHDLFVYTSWTGLFTNIVGSNIVFQAYGGNGGTPNTSGSSSFLSNGIPAFTPSSAAGPLTSASSMSVTNGYWARMTNFDFTNSFNTNQAVSNAVSFTSIGGVGFIYWTVANTGTNYGTNFTMTYSVKNGL